jgi:L-alanine-DL-glutamate epimerase-like enolase superfamily enzyme
MLLSRLHQMHEQWFSSTWRVVKADCPIVVIETDAGITGIGEACAYGGPEQIRDWVAFFGEGLAGADPLHLGIAPAPHYRNSAHDCAVAGIDCALWDIRARHAGTTVAQLLVDLQLTPRTAPALDAVWLYASSGVRYDWGADPRQLIEETLGYIAQGYTAEKIRIGTHWPWHGVTVDRFIGLLRELTQAVRATGKRFDLALDCNQRLTEAQALLVAAELDRLGFAWLEEPIPQTDIAGYARIAAAAELPITGGEQFTTLAQFKPYLDARAYDIVQPDMGWSGITEGLKIASYAHRRGIKTVPHGWHNGLMVTANAHFVAALPEPMFNEHCMVQGPLQWAILNEAPDIRDGMLRLAGPGYGVTLAPDLETRFPYFTGTWNLAVQREG